MSNFYATPHPADSRCVAIVDNNRTMSRMIAVIRPATPSVVPLEGQLAGIPVMPSTVETMAADDFSDVGAVAIANSFAGLYRRLIDGDIAYYPQGTPQRVTGVGIRFTPQ